MREDYRKQLIKAHEELVFKYVRFHGLFNDDMSVCLEKSSHFPNVPGEIIYNLVNINNIFDFLLSIGMKPFVEIGFMPECLALGKETASHYKGKITPTADYGKWDNLSHAFIEHLGEGYGMEEIRSCFLKYGMNLICHFSGQEHEQYFELYENTARTIKNYNSDTLWFLKEIEDYLGLRNRSTKK